MSPPKNQKDTLAKLDHYHRQDKDNPGEDGHATNEGKVRQEVILISSCQTTLTTKIEEVKVDISLIRQDLQKLSERVKTSEKLDGVRWKMQSCRCTPMHATKDQSTADKTRSH